MTAGNDSALPYMTLTGVFGAFTLVLLMAFLVVVVCLCIHHRKQVTGKNQCMVVHMILCSEMHVLIFIKYSMCSLITK